MLDQLKRNLLVRTLIGLIIFTGVATAQFIDTSAQSGSEEWSAPVNLSNSGSTKDPQLVVDSSGIFHAIWIDEFDGYVYAQSNDGVQWSAPLPMSFPFLVEDSTPLLLSGPDGYIHALWKGAENVLFYSHVLSVEFGNPAAWRGPQGLAESALDFDALIDSKGILHISYVRPLTSGQFPAGVYYRKSFDSGQSWSDGISLYQSKYFRTLNPNDAHVNISSTNVDGGEHIYVAWDDRLIKRVFLTKSFDEGETWETPAEIDGPSAGTVTTAPFNIIVQPKNENLLVIWQSGLQSGFDCNQYFQWSQDRGNTWSERQLMLENIVGCPSQNKLFQASDGTTVLWTIVQDRVYLSAWNGASWSETIVQPNVNSFTNPDTLEGVNLRCRQPNLEIGDQLLVVGCDTVSTKDIWFTAYTIPAYSYWFPSADLWSPPKIVSTSYRINDPQAVFDVDETLHVFWSQLDDNTGLSKYSIYYAQYTDNTWSHSVKILSTPREHSESPSVAYDTSGRLLVVWESSESGEILFSWALASSAVNPFEWSNPTYIPTSSSNAGSPDIIVDDSGNIYVAFAGKLNEGRGIYLSKSTDAGSTWETPVKVFDAAAVGWQLVDEPQLTRTENGHLYIIWKRYSLIEDSAIGLYYSKSEDGGNSWSIPETITDQITTDAHIMGFGMQGVHRFWESEENSVLSLWHQVSTDNGVNWNIPENLSGFGETPIAFSITGDEAERIYLVDAVEDASENFLVNLLAFSDETWTYEEVYSIEKSANIGMKSVATDLSFTGKLAVIFIQQTQSSEGEVYEDLYFSDRSVQLPISIPSPEMDSTVSPTEETDTQIPTPSQESATPLTITITPTVDKTILDPGVGNTSSFLPISGTSGLIIGIVLSILLVGTVFLVGLYKIKRPDR